MPSKHQPDCEIDSAAKPRCLLPVPSAQTVDVLPAPIFLFLSPNLIFGLGERATEGAPSFFYLRLSLFSPSVQTSNSRVG